MMSITSSGYGVRPRTLDPGLAPTAKVLCLNEQFTETTVVTALIWIGRGGHRAGAERIDPVLWRNGAGL
jgi:hypothetical protein